MTGASDHLREYLTGNGVTDAQITAAFATRDQDEAWLRTAAHLSMHILQLTSRGDQDGLRQAQEYIRALDAQMVEIAVTPDQRVRTILHPLLRQAAELARDIHTLHHQSSSTDPGVAAAQRAFQRATLTLAIGADVADRLANDPTFDGDRSEQADRQRAEMHEHDLQQYRAAEAALDAAHRDASRAERAESDHS